MDDIMPMRVEDLDFAVKITHQEGWGYKKEDLHRILKWSPSGCFVLWNEGRRAGIATTLFYKSFGWIGNVVVNKDLRGRGLGVAITKKCVSHLYGRGAKGVRLFAYENTKSFYEKMGFKFEETVHVFRRPIKNVSKVDLPTGYDISVLTNEKAELDAIFDLDLAAFGGDRSQVLKTIWKGNPELTFVLRKGKHLHGFIVGKEVLGNVEIGPWTCTLPDLKPSIALLDTLMAKANTTIFMAVPESQKAGIKVLREKGFESVDRVYGMGIGQLPLMRYDWTFAVGALEKG